MILRLVGIIALLFTLTCTSSLYAQKKRENVEERSAMVVLNTGGKGNIVTRTTWKEWSTCEESKTDEMLLVRTYSDGSQEYCVMWCVCGLNCYHEGGWAATPEKADALALEQKRSKGISIAKPVEEALQ